MGPDASSGLSNPRPNFEDPATQSFDFEFLPGGSIQIIAESDEHLVSQPMQENLFDKPLYIRELRHFSDPQSTRIRISCIIRARSFGCGAVPCGAALLTNLVVRVRCHERSH